MTNFFSKMVREQMLQGQQP